jgi:hypothetical protein
MPRRATCSLSTNVCSVPRSLVFLRWTAVLHAVSAFLQPVLAGSYLSGNPLGLTLHSANANLVSLLGIVMLVIAIVFWRRGGSGRITLAATVIVVIEELQLGLGYSRDLAFHIPLGTGVVVGSVWFAIWTFRPAARRSRKVEEATV